MKSVGIKSIDKLLDDDINHIPRVLVKNNKESYKCRIFGYWYEVLFEHVSKGKIMILGFKFTSEANDKDRIAFIEMNNNNETLKLELGVYGNTYTEDIKVERQGYEIINPQCFLQGADKIIIPIKQDEPTVIERRPYSPMRTKHCYMDGWWIVNYEHTTPGHVVIHVYKRSKNPGVLGEEVVIPEIHQRKGIHKINVIKWGKGAEKNTFIVDNPHSFIQGA
jgi:hypothetical protein